MRRPTAVPFRRHRWGTVIAIKRPAAAATPSLAMTSCRGPPVMPSVKGPKVPEPIVYKGARIYTSLARRSWRIIMEPPNMASEVSVAWGSDTAAAWEKVKKRIRDTKG